MGLVCEAGDDLVTLGRRCRLPAAKERGLWQQGSPQTELQQRDGGKAVLRASFDPGEWVAPCDWSLQLARSAAALERKSQNGKKPGYRGRHQDSCSGWLISPNMMLGTDTGGSGDMGTSLQLAAVLIISGRSQKRAPQGREPAASEGRGVGAGAGCASSSPLFTRSSTRKRGEPAGGR